MEEWLEKRIKEFEKKAEWLKNKKGFCDLYHFGYCPKCKDVTRIDFFGDPDPRALPRRSFTKCLKCGFTELQFSQNPERIMVCGNEIPPQFKRKWERRHSPSWQMKLLKEEMNNFLEGLKKGISEKRNIYREAKQHLKKFI